MAEPTNALAPKSVNILRNLATHPNPMQYLMQLASERPEYAAVAEYLAARNATPPVSFGYLPSGTSGTFGQNGLFNQGEYPETGAITLNRQFLDRAYAPTNAIPTLTHEMIHAAQKEMFRQADQKDIANPEAKQKFLDARKKLIYDSNQRHDKRFVQSELAKKLDPEWAKNNEEYCSSVTELPAWAIANVMGKEDSYDSYKPPAHLNSTLATEYQILLDLATRDAKANPNKKTR